MSKTFKIWKRGWLIPMLTLHEDMLGFMVCCDASRVCLCCIMMQNGKIIAYTYQNLEVHEKNYSIHDLELAAIVYSLKI